MSTSRYCYTGSSRTVDDWIVEGTVLCITHRRTCTAYFGIFVTRFAVLSASTALDGKWFTTALQKERQTERSRGM